MQHHDLPNYLRTFRKRAYLSQEELAFLLGVKDGSAVSRYELDERRPSFETVVAYEVIFGTTIRELFPGWYRKVEAEVLRRARDLKAEAVSGGGVARRGALLEHLRRRTAETNEAHDGDER